MVNDNFRLMDVLLDAKKIKDLFLLSLAGLMIGLILIVAIQFFFSLSSIMVSRLGLVWDFTYYYPAVVGGIAGGLWYFYYESQHSSSASEMKNDAFSNLESEIEHQLEDQARIEQHLDKTDNKTTKKQEKRISDHYFFLLILTFLVYVLELLSEGIPVFFMYFLLSSGWIALLTFHLLKMFL